MPPAGHNIVTEQKDLKKIKFLLKSDIALFVIALLFFFLNFNYSQSYSPFFTHPDLTEQMAKLFNAKNNSAPDFSAREINYLREGAIREDEAPRWINHFYDPIHNEGWRGKHFGQLSEAAGLQTGASLAPRPPLMAPDWALNQAYQAAYGRQYGNQTWQKALHSYIQGDKKSAYLALGHVLHLIEDSSVPDHTRNDTHAHLHGDPGSPYEEYAEEFTNHNKLTVADDLLKEGRGLIVFNNLRQAFRDLAIYSNENFFSEDTISNEEYKNPNLKSLRKKILSNDNKERLFIFDEVKNKEVILGVILNNNLYSTDNKIFVLPSYRTNIFPEVVLNGASVIDLFFREAEYYRQHPDELEPLIEDSSVPLSSAFFNIPKFFALKIKDVKDQSVGAVQKTLSATKLAVNTLFNNIKNELGFGTPARSEPPGQLSTPSAPPVPPAPAPAAPVAVAPPTPAPIVRQPNPPAALPRTTPRPPAPPTAPRPSTPPSIPAAPTVPLNLPTTPPSPAPSEPSSPFTGSASRSQNTSATTAAQTVITSSSSTASSATSSSSTASEGGSETSDTSTTSSTDSTSAIVIIPAPVLNPPFNSITYATSSEVNITGTVTSTAVKVFVYRSATSTHDPASGAFVVPTSSAWSFYTALANGHNYFYFLAETATGAISTFSAPAHIILDTTPPSMPAVTIRNLSGPDSTNLEIMVTSTDAFSPIVSYDVEHSLSPTTTDWTSLAFNTPSTTHYFSGERGRTYYFRARARDSAGNTSAWSTDNAPPPGATIALSQQVVINEIAWAGTAADFAFDEWLELYNNTSSTIDLSRWLIKVNGRRLDFDEIKNPLLPSGGFALLERDTDNTVRDIPADIIFSLSRGLSNDGARVELFNSDGVKVDEINAVGGWFAGDNVKYRSMERVSPRRAGSDPANWQSNQGARLTGRSFNGGALRASARQPNFGFIALNSRQDEQNRILTKQNNPYILVGYEIPAGFTLTVEPGVVIKAYTPESVIDVYGTLAVLGGPADRVVFTSGRDASLADPLVNTILRAGGETGAPSAKDWQGIWLHEGANGIFAGADFRYAGHEFRLNHLVFTPLVSEAIHADQAELAITDSIFRDTGATIVVARQTPLTVTDTTFTSGITAIDADESPVTLTGVAATGFTNPLGPFVIKRRWPTIDDLTLRDNTHNSLHIDRAEITGTVTLKKDFEFSFINPTITPGATLIIEAGTVLSMPPEGAITVNGILDIRGTASEPVTIRSAASATNDDFWGALILNNATATIRHAVFTRGNRSQTMDAMIVAENSRVVIEHSTLVDPRAPGHIIRAKDTRLEIKNSILGYSVRPTFFSLSAGLHLTGGSARLESVRLQNLDVGIIGLSLPLPSLQLVNIGLGSFPGVQDPINPILWIDANGNSINFQ